MDTAFRLGVILLLGYLAVVLLLFLLQERLLFFPRPVFAEPAAPDAVAATVRRPDAILRGWVTNPDAAGPLLIYFGGNAEELSGAVPTFARLNAVAALINYRGYGASDGSPAAADLIADAAAVVEAMQRRYGAGRPTILFGRSLGSGIAALAAQAPGVDGVILISPYRSIERIAQARYPFIPVRWLLRHNIDAAPAAPRLPARALIMYANEDRVVPTAESQAFAALLPKTARVAAFDGPHGAALETPLLWREIQAFLARFG